MTDEYMTRVGVEPLPEPATYAEFIDAATEEREDDGARILHAGDWTPRCHDCGAGELLWAEAGYVPWHRICNRCGSHWDLHPVTYYLDRYREGEISWFDWETGELYSILHGSPLASPMGPASRVEGSPDHAELLALLRDEHFRKALDEARGSRGVPTVAACWARRARFY